MAQHFLLSRPAKTLSLASVFRMSDAEAEAMFRKVRWPETEGAPVCPACGGLNAYECRRPSGALRFRCRACRKDFSVTSGTLFAFHKLPLRGYLAAIVIFCNEVKGKSALALSRDLAISYKAAFVLAHKLREALAAEVENHTLDGEVEIDGAYFGGSVRPANFAEDRVDRRLSENQSGTRRVVIAIRQRKGRTLTFVGKSEAEGVELAARVVSRKSVVFADEAGHWDRLHRAWIVGRINHREAYSADGANTNQVESFFSRLRRMVAGQHHGVSPKYLHQYSAHAAWLEDHRRRSNGENHRAVIGNAVHHPVSTVWAGYWQRHQEH